MTTLSEENYLKAIYHLGKQGATPVSTNAIAEKVESKASSVTDMVKKLADKNLANYVKYQGVSLTNKGRLAATLVIRKHRLWEVFLVNKLNFSWDEVHEVAEQLEHVKSLKLVNELDAFLEYPTHDPHGDPIPDKDGNYSPIKSVNIFDVDKGKEGVLSFVKDSTDTFLKYLNKNKLALGDTIKVLDYEPFDNSLTIETKTRKMIISKEVAQNLYLSL
ncbi:DtxR family transcriptional regulator, Mn-dependent transcriptional regulator [Flaviramulus basaltis]|uniref:Transcriptional regulator MntR n=1 Tax=Flaviramulus basaltis TaxID=369401 RepID=A0A1K2ICD3_9FLAO|nr:metal-dependent transcriptional regulator [Flaviramulus basaltis]SFZ89902.1 DtxR family transcriptional regulator, Mn-dependent transcriptional regulator [Flaviramulus basaltis]